MSVEGTKMPEPVATAISSGIAIDLIRVRVRPNSSVDVGQKLYTADQMREFANEAMRLAMERAIEACDNVEEKPWHGYENPNTFDDGKRACIAALRALADVAAQEGKP